MGGKRRHVLGLFLVGWLTAVVWPSVSMERQTIVVHDDLAENRVSSRTRDGWVVTCIDTMGRIPVVQLERPRYLSVYFDLRERPRGSWCWLTTGDWYC